MRHDTAAERFRLLVRGCELMPTGTDATSVSALLRTFVDALADDPEYAEKARRLWQRQLSGDHHLFAQLMAEYTAVGASRQIDDTIGRDDVPSLAAQLSGSHGAAWGAVYADSLLDRLLDAGKARLLLALPAQLPFPRWTRAVITAQSLRRWHDAVQPGTNWRLTADDLGYELWRCFAAPEPECKDMLAVVLGLIREGIGTRWKTPLERQIMALVEGSRFRIARQLAACDPTLGIGRRREPVYDFR